MFYYLALEGAAELINKSADFTKDISEGWDEIWQDTIVNAPPNEIYALIVQGASWLALVSTAVWVISWAPRFIRGQLFIQSAFYLIIPLLIFLGLANTGNNIANFAYGINRLILYGNEIVLDQQVASINIKESIQNMNLTDIAASELRDQFNRCANLDPALSGGSEVDPRKKCFEELEAETEQLREQFEADYCSDLPPFACSGAVQSFTEFGQALGEAITKANDKYNDSNPDMFYSRFMLIETSKRVGNYLLGSRLKSGMGYILRAIQFGYMNMLVGGMFLLGLSAPFFVAASLIPFQPRTFWSWLIGFLSFGLAIFFYNTLVGMSALLMVKLEAQTFTQLQYAFMLGFFAPAIASGLASWSAWAAAKNAGQSGAQLASASIGSLVSIFRFVR
jgi:hypothetical protein